MTWGLTEVVIGIAMGAVGGLAASWLSVWLLHRKAERDLAQAVTRRKEHLDNDQPKFSQPR